MMKGNGLTKFNKRHNMEKTEARIDASINHRQPFQNYSFIRLKTIVIRLRQVQAKETKRIECNCKSERDNDIESRQSLTFCAADQLMVP